MSSNSQSTPPVDAMFQLITGKWVTSAVSAAARLGVADHLESGSKSTRELAEKLNVNEDALYRLLRAIAGVGVFHEEEARNFSQTPLSDLLRSNAKPCLRNMAMMMSDPWHTNCWTELNWCVETGKSAPYKLYGMSAFEYLSKHPDEAVNFNNAMTDLSLGDGPAVVSCYDFSRFESIVDVGGGMGALLAGVLESAPRLQGTLFDMPYVIDQARSGSILSRFADRCSFEGGSFFAAVPAADAYIMKYIIHDWDDERAGKILANCRQAIRAGGKLLVVDRVVGPPNVPDPTKFMDMEMLVLPGGLERNEAEWNALFAANGFRLRHIISTPGPMRIMEADPIA
jgi:hypothetical protein